MISSEETENPKHQSAKSLENLKLEQIIKNSYDSILVTDRNGEVSKAEVDAKRDAFRDARKAFRAVKSTDDEARKAAEVGDAAVPAPGGAASAARLIEIACPAGGSCRRRSAGSRSAAPDAP